MLKMEQLIKVVVVVELVILLMVEHKLEVMVDQESLLLDTNSKINMVFTKNNK